MKKSFKLLVLGLVILGIGLRLFRLNELFHFTMDEALIAFRALGLFKYSRPFLIGGISPLQVHLPPYFYYLASGFLALFNFNPVGWGIVAAFIGGLTIYLVYRRFGLLAAFLYTFSFTAVFFDRHFWPLVLNPLLTLLTFILLPKLSKKSFWPYIFLAFTLVLAFTADPSNLPLLLTVLTFFIINKSKLRLKFSFSGFILAATAFLAPLIAFDIRHSWVNFSSVTKLFSSITPHKFSLIKLIDALLLIPRSLARFWYSPQTNLVELHSYCIPFATSRQHDLPLVLVLLAIIVLIWFLISTKQKTIRFLILFYMFGITLFGALGFSIFDHYLTGLLPIFAYITAKFILRLPKLLSASLIILFILINLWQISQVSNPYGLKAKQDLVSWTIDELQGAPFALDSISKCHKENGLRYLFELTDNPPQQSFMDPNFFWLYKDLPAEKMPQKVLLVTDKPLMTQLPILIQKSFGDMNAYILDNQLNFYTFQTNN